MIKVGIVTANYNNAKYLEEWLDGLKNQVVKPNYISFVDDCSTDDSIEVLKKLLECEGNIEDGPISCTKWGMTFNIQVNTVNSGPAKSRNESVKWLSTTDTNLCMVYDSDDIYYPNKVKATVDLYKKYPFTGIIYSDYDMIYNNGNDPKREFKEPFSLDRLTNECIISNNSAYPIKLFNEVGGYDESLYGPEDYDLWLRISEMCCALHIPEALYAYRVSETQLTSSTDMNEFAQHVKRVHEKTYIRRTNANH